MRYWMVLSRFLNDGLELVDAVHGEVADAAFQVGPDRFDIWRMAALMWVFKLSQMTTNRPYFPPHCSEYPGQVSDPAGCVPVAGSVPHGNSRKAWSSTVTSSPHRKLPQEKADSHLLRELSHRRPR